jgi:Helix-turn-helix domain
VGEPDESNATVRRMLVGARLRRLREERGISREEAGYLIRASESKMSRLEHLRRELPFFEGDNVHGDVTDSSCAIGSGDGVVT